MQEFSKENNTCILKYANKHTEQKTGVHQNIMNFDTFTWFQGIVKNDEFLLFYQSLKQILMENLEIKVCL